MSNPLFIKVPIQCFSKNHNHEEFRKVKDLGVKVEPDFEQRLGYLQHSEIAIFYPHTEEGQTVLELKNGLDYVILMPIHKFVKLLHSNGCVFE